MAASRSGPGKWTSGRRRTAAMLERPTIHRMPAPEFAFSLVTNSREPELATTSARATSDVPQAITQRRGAGRIDNFLGMMVAARSADGTTEWEACSPSSQPELGPRQGSIGEEVTPLTRSPAGSTPTGDRASEHVGEGIGGRWSTATASGLPLAMRRTTRRCIAHARAGQVVERGRADFFVTDSADRRGGDVRVFPPRAARRDHARRRGGGSTSSRAA